MRRVEYPLNLDRFKGEYLTVFNISSLQKEWKALRKTDKILRSNFPEKITRILLADYRRLVKYYLTFRRKIMDNPKYNTQKKKLYEDIKKIFNYENGYQSGIARFFMNHSLELKISVCNYCETAYINAYELYKDPEYLKFLNNASKIDISKKLGIKDSSSLDEIIALRPITSIDDLDNIGIKKKWWRTKGKMRKVFPKFKNHFDIDHVLDKGACPIVALSLMNFVPSCQVCNERLKRSYILGDIKSKIPKTHMSPSSSSYDFDDNVKFVINPIPKKNGALPELAFAIDEREWFELDFDIDDNDFIDFIQLFQLKERYKFHKTEALRWIQLKERYSDACIELMSKSLGLTRITKDLIKEDLFREDFDTVHIPCFYKLKRDCLHP